MLSTMQFTKKIPSEPIMIENLENFTGDINFDDPELYQQNNLPIFPTFDDLNLVSQYNAYKDFYIKTLFRHTLINYQRELCINKLSQIISHGFEFDKIDNNIIPINNSSPSMTDSICQTDNNIIVTIPAKTRLEYINKEISQISRVSLKLNEDISFSIADGTKIQISSTQYYLVKKFKKSELDFPCIPVPSDMIKIILPSQTSIIPQSIGIPIRIDEPLEVELPPFCVLKLRAGTYLQQVDCIQAKLTVAEDIEDHENFLVNLC